MTFQDQRSSIQNFLQLFTVVYLGSQHSPNDFGNTGNGGATINIKLSMRPRAKHGASPRRPCQRSLEGRLREVIIKVCINERNNSASKISVIKSRLSYCWKRLPSNQRLHAADSGSEPHRMIQRPDTLVLDQGTGAGERVAIGRAVPSTAERCGCRCAVPAARPASPRPQCRTTQSLR